jgi:hypothetical protein
MAAAALCRYTPESWPIIPGAWLLGGIMDFRLSTPRRETFLVSVVIAVLVIIGMIVPLPFFTAYALGLLLIAYLILLAGVLLDNL